MKSTDNEVISLLFKKYHDTLINYCRRNGHSEHNAKDFVDETFLRLTKNIDKVKDRHPKEQRSWLYSTVERVIHEHNYKNRKIEKRDSDPSEDTPSDSDDFMDFINKGTYPEIVKEIYRRLSDEDIAFLDDYINGRISYSQIVTEENKNYNTVKSQVYRRILSIRKTTEEVLKEHDIEVSEFTDKKNNKPKK